MTAAAMYDEPIDSLRIKASYESRKASIEELDAALGGGQVSLSGEFDHPQDSLKSGNIQFHVSSSGVNLARLRTVQARQSGL